MQMHFDFDSHVPGSVLDMMICMTVDSAPSVAACAACNACGYWVSGAVQWAYANWHRCLTVNYSDGDLSPGVYKLG